MYQYTAYHLNIASEIELPAIRKASFDAKKADVTISYAELPEELEDPSEVKPFFQAKPQQLLAKMAETGGRILVENGTTIKIDAPDVDPKICAIFAIGTGISNIINQRNFLIIHGNTVHYEGSNFIVCGKSGAGKSTTTTALLQKGAKVIADDISPIHFDEDGQPWVSPGIPFSKLWPETFDLLGLHDQTHHQLSPLLEKRFIPLSDEQTIQQDVRLDAVFFLASREDIDAVEYVALTPTDALLSIRHNSYGYRHIRGMQQLDVHFDRATKLAETVPFFHIRRPAEVRTIEQVVELVTKQLNQIQLETVTA
ncbi:MAG: hypothetical protein P1U63_03935 [Coxiellaceae bacterium]|nr:hypothetical protein [Coxiellaceae bacterium]